MHACGYERWPDGCCGTERAARCRRSESERQGEAHPFHHRGCAAESETEKAAYKADDRGLEQKLCEDHRLRRTEGAARADLRAPLTYREQLQREDTEYARRQ